ncbi:MAG: ester cyclase [Candidatus Dormibacteraeota bacterium]|nr:ester cyclase [Candidatus Dormibacteraeota bacterium]
MSELREIFDRGERAFNEHDVDAVMALYAPDARFRGPGGMDMNEAGAIRQFTVGWFQGFPDCRIRTTRVIEAGDTIIQEGVFTGTQTGVFPTPMGDIPPTNKAVEGPFVDVYVFSDGKIVDDHLYFDRMELMEQLGLVPAPAAAGG